MSSFVFDPNAAAKAGSSFIFNSGVYFGTIKNVEIITTARNTKGIMIENFNSNTGEQANFLKLYTRDSEGEPLFGYNIFNALLGLLNINNFDTVNKDRKVTIPILDNKKIGIALQHEDYQKNDGGIGYSMKIINFFDYNTKQTYLEKRDGKDATAYKREIKDKLLTYNNYNQSNFPNNLQSGNDQSNSFLDSINSINESELPF